MDVGVTVEVLSVPFTLDVKFLPETGDACWSFEGEATWFDSVVILLLFDIFVIIRSQKSERLYILRITNPGPYRSQVLSKVTSKNITRTNIAIINNIVACTCENCSKVWAANKGLGSGSSDDTDAVELVG